MVAKNTLHAFRLFFFVTFFSAFDVFNTVNSSLVNVTRTHIWQNGDTFATIFLALKGNVYPDGNYSVTLNIGNPPKPYDLDIDTGSTITWVQCDAPCAHCTLPKDRQYKPGNVVPCGNALCTGLSSDEKQPCLDPEDQCDYIVQYADQGNSLGVLVHDKFSFRLPDRTLITPDISFGCGYDNQSPAPNSGTPPGVLALGNEGVGILYQLTVMGFTRNVFGHCLGSQDGALFIGDGLLRTPRLSWVPMQGNSMVYSSGPVEVYHIEQATGIQLPSVIFDTGSTYTYFNQQAYRSVFDRIKNDLIGKPLEIAPEDETLPECWKSVDQRRFRSVDEAKIYFNPLTLTFSQASNAQFNLPPEAYLIVNQYGNICFGILEAPPALGNANIIGDISMQNKLFIYDNISRRIGWTAAKCKPPPPPNA